MRRLRLCIVIVALCGTFLIAQEQTPSAASVTSAESVKVRPGQNFDFQLEFNKTPEGYGGGRIIYQFQNIADSGHSAEGGSTSEGGSIDLHDGQAIYKISLPITESMDKGKWKLIWVKVGKATLRDVRIPDNVVFDIPLPPPIIHIRAPERVVAGNSFNIGVILDEIPQVPEECTLTVGFGVRPVVQVPEFNGPGGQAVPVQSDRRSYEMTAKLDADVPSGAWKGLVSFGVGPKPSVEEEGRRCRYLGFPSWFETEFSFTVEPAPTLVSPTAAAVTVNPSQIQLLLGEADLLKGKAKQLEEQLASGSKTSNQELLRNSLLEVNEDLNKTEAAFKAKGVEESSVRDVNDFFDDIRFGYREASKSASLRGNDGQLLRVSAARSAASLNASRVLKSIRRNADAYDLVASTRALTFNLDVYSEPKGATITYRLRGDEYHSVDHATDW